MDAATPTLDKRRREAKPERLRIGDETFVRNDIKAREQGVCERTLNRLDCDGAPYLFVGAVKYRPETRYDAFLLGRIQQHKPQPLSRRSRPRRS
jgi:hypothetical protein